MAEIHPNDIGLATFADVGNVERLRTSAKTVVEAINEIYQTGGSQSVLGDQLYVDGENNVIFGTNNAVYGSNNLIIGSNNVLVGNGHNLIGSERYGFGAGYYGKVNADYSTAFSYYTYCYSLYSNAFGYYSRIYGRPLKYTAINNTAKTLTLASGQTTTNLAGKKLILRCYNSNNTIMFHELTISSVSGTTIYLASDSYMGGSGSYAYSLFPDGYVFVADTSSSYSMADFVTGHYCLASSKYTFAQGYFNSAFHEGAAIFGKYGITQEPYSLVLGNSTSLKAPGIAFKVLSDGSVHADGEYTSPCADYAEYFEWEDGNPDNEDRTGYFVKLNGEKIVKCSPFDKPLGIVSAMPAIIGDSGEMHWKGKFLTDDFGRVQYHDVIVPAEFDEE